MRSSQLRSFLGLVLCAVVFMLTTRDQCAAQSSPMPTSPTGTNSVEVVDGKYQFKFNGQVLYGYLSGNDSLNYDGTGGVLASVSAYTYDGKTNFIPSFTGAPIIDINGIDKFSYEASFVRLAPDSSAGDTIITRWKMRVGTAWFSYVYRFHISGRTLVLRVEALGGSNGIGIASGFLLDRCEHAVTPQVVRVPYLSLFNLISCNNSFVSVFADWERTNCSEYTREPWPEYVYEESVRFPPRLTYRKKIDGNRNPLKETIYITVSPDLDGALPNVAGPVAPARSQAISRNVLFYQPTYSLSFANGCRSNKPNPLTYNYWDSLYQRGVRNLAAIFSSWQRLSCSRGNPNVLPANPFNLGARQRCDLCANISDPDSDGNAILRTSLEYVIGKQYSVGLYENYVDYQTEAGVGSYCYDPSDRTLLPDGTTRPGWMGTDCSPSGQSFILKPSRATAYANYWASQIQSTIYNTSPLSLMPKWSYLDVSSSANPSDEVDYDTCKTGAANAGKFLYTLQQYRTLPDTRRIAYNYGPVIGEGGNPFLFAGYFDDFDGRIKTGTDSVYGYRAPVLVDFDIKKIRPKSAMHGVGHQLNFFANNEGGWNTDPRTLDEMRQFIATELAFGHGGLATLNGYDGDLSIEQAVLEEQHVWPTYRDIANASIVSILYGVEQTSASAYIKAHPDYSNMDSPDFMSQVRVTYDNGVIVCVNRHLTQQWTVSSVGSPGAWFAYHAIINGKDSVGTGVMTTSTFTLPARNGWVVYDPLQ